MMMHTTVPLEIVFQGVEDLQPSEVIQVDGMMMEVQSVNHRQVRVVRLLSPLPEHFLLLQYSPGAIIEYHPGLVR